MLQENECARGAYSQKREETIAKVKAAVDALRENGIKVTRQAIADESDICIATLDQGYIKDFLRSYGAIKQRSQASSSPEEESIKLQKKLDSAHKEIQKLLDKLERKNSEISELKQKYKDLEIRYEKVLGHCQRIGETNHDRKFTQL